MEAMISVCERIANDPKMPVRLVDWAVGVYDRLTDGDAVVTVKDLRILHHIIEDYEYGLRLLDRRLSE